jgi:oligoribonuclease NrnB/cAMP/cGMP phosphodiesterase (DHH superfamily)
MENNTICIYHKNCTDGTFSASVLLKKFKNCKLFPLEHGYSEEEFEEILKEVDENTTVYITDFSLRKDDLKKLLENAKEVVNIDHHIGVKDQLEEIAKENPKFKFYFDNDSSGASLTWKVLFGEDNIPEIIKLVEDKDLWKWRYGDRTKYANLYLYMMANKPEEVLQYLDTDPEEIIEKGKIIAIFVDYLINKFIEKAEPTLIKIGDYVVKAFNTGNFQSEIGNILAQKLGEAVALFSIKGYEVRFSFRSVEGQKPTSLELAKLLGGGGHKHAAGAMVTLDKFCEMIIFNKEGEENG